MPNKLKKIDCCTGVVANELDNSPAKLDIIAQINHWDEQYWDFQSGREDKCRTSVTP